MVKVNGYGVFLSSSFFSKDFSYSLLTECLLAFVKRLYKYILELVSGLNQNLFHSFDYLSISSNSKQDFFQVNYETNGCEFFCFILLLFYVLCLILFGSFFLFLNKFHLFHVACSQIYTTNMIML